MDTQTRTSQPTAGHPHHSTPIPSVALPSFREQLYEPFREPLFTMGLLLLVCSALVFLLHSLPFTSLQTSDSNTIAIIIHYGLAIIFSINVWSHGLLKRQASGHPVRWLALLLWLISAYALNRSMSVFQESTPWLCCLLVLTGLAMVLHTWKEMLSVRAQQLLYALLTVGWCLFVYLAIYVTPLYLISVPLLLGLGLSIHTFVPFAFAFSLGHRLWRGILFEEHLQLGIGLGFAFPFAAIILFSSFWARDVHRMEGAIQEATIRKTTDIPEWVLIAQQLDPQHPFTGWITERLLQGKHVYDEGEFWQRSGSVFGSTTTDNAHKHDPLVLIAATLFPASILSENEQLSVLRVLTADRHSMEEKYWTGRHLVVRDVVTQVRIWPAYRVSYTEQTLTIHNTAQTTTEEALFTFHLPAGSTVSSMSLWINGRQEPARLTTVAKADSAYRTIVDLESRRVARDPSAVYWREGNRITVRVFPCRAGTDRRVKLGITSPLALDAGQLTYQPPYAEGPSPRSARELIHIDFATPPTQLQTSLPAAPNGNTTLSYQGDYTTDWSVQFQAPPLPTMPFVLDGYAYQLQPSRRTYRPFSPTDVYLDVNQAWKKDEFMAVYQAVSQQTHCRIWVFDDGLQQLTPSQLEATYERLSQQRFSLFPIYRIKNPQTALFITKSTAHAPYLSDLQNSIFAQRMDALAEQSAPIPTVCLLPSNPALNLSPYLNSLAELNVLNVSVGTTDELNRYLIQKTFPEKPNSLNRVELPSAGVVIEQRKAADSKQTNAPDHLARLFGYNQLLTQLGRHYFRKNYPTDSLIQLAQTAHVVSPVSSLVVLETTADYDRFKIHKDASGLDNATLRQEGAVPEPHEWAILLALLSFMGWLRWRQRHAAIR